MANDYAVFANPSPLHRATLVLLGVFNVHTRAMPQAWPWLPVHARARGAPVSRWQS
jgi:hypothetical protein